MILWKTNLSNGHWYCVWERNATFLSIFDKEQLPFAFWRTHGIDSAYEPKRVPKPLYLTQSWADWVGSKRWNAFFVVFKLNYGKKPFECTVLKLLGTKCGSYKQFWKLTIFEIFWQNSNLLKIRPKFQRFPGINYFSILRLI